MQELSVQPTNPTPYTPAGGTYNNNPVPGAGGLPSLSGLSRNMNPMAQELQAQGRGDDSVLIHMTPDEVNSLRGLAQKFGGDLTTNPNTGLPEAGWLGKLLPTILGIAGAAVGIPTWAIGAGVGVGQTALTGDLNKGLMAGLQAFGGATMAGSLGVGQAPVTSAIPEAGANLAPGAATSAATSQLAALPPEIAAAAGNVAPTVGNVTLQTAAPTIGQTLASGVGSAAPAASTALQAAAPTLGQTIASQAPRTLLAPGMGAQATPGFLDRFSGIAREGMKAGTIPYKVAPYAAGLGTLSAVSDVTAPRLPEYQPEEDKWDYKGPYLPMPRRLRPTVQGEGEISFFEDANPYPGYLPAGYAEGGDTTDVSKMSHADLISKGYMDPATGVRSQLQAGVTPEMAGMISSLGNQNFIVNKQGQWEAYTPPAPVVTPATQPAATSARLGLTGLPAITPTVTPTATNTTTRVTDTSTPTRNTETVRTSTQTSPATTGPAPSGFGVRTLGDLYTPQFTQRADYVTPRNAPYALGSQLASQMPQFVSQFQTSPGAITASRTYPGGSPSERIRAMAKANAAASPSPMAEMNFGFKTPTAADNPYAPGGYMNNFTTDIVNRYLADYGYAPFDLAAPGGGFGPAVNNAKGGEIRMDDGAFVVDARTVSELGNGSSSAGQELLARLGGRPVKGPGDGVSDSIRANIGGRQEARVARDEVIFPADAVKKLGGAKKLYALMDKAHKARKKAERGEDTKVAKGLGALK